MSIAAPPAASDQPTPDAGTQVRRGTSGEKGLGLGLQLCHRYAASCGGELRVSSQPGRGTRFELRLPLRQD